MAIVTISRGCFSHGKEIAEKTAKQLGYKIVSREILLEAAEYFNVSEKELLKSIHNAPTFLERMTNGKNKYLTCIRASLLKHVKNDNVVYHGHAGQVLLPDINNIVKVRIIADMDERINFLKQVENFSKNQARAYIEKEDMNRAKWTQYVYKFDIHDPKLYDLVIKIGKLNIQDACDIICATVKTNAYKTTRACRKKLEDISLSSYIKVALQNICNVDVISKDGNIHVKASCPKIKKQSYTSSKMKHNTQGEAIKNMSKKISDIVSKIDGVKEFVCDIEAPLFH